MDMPDQVLPEIPDTEEERKDPRRKWLDPEQVFRLAAMGCSNYEIARFFNVSESFIRKRYTDVVEAGRVNIKVRLRAAQIREALAGNTTMLIWLGKQLLSQGDQGERNADDNQPLPWRDE